MKRFDIISVGIVLGLIFICGSVRAGGLVPSDNLKTVFIRNASRHFGSQRISAPSRQLSDDGSALMTGSARTIPERDRVSELMQKSGMRFTENRGQIADADGRVRHDILFDADAPGAKLFFRNDGISYVFTDSNIGAESIHPAIDAAMTAVTTQQRERSCHRLDMFLVGCNPHARIRSDAQLPGYVNYYLPHCPNGVTGVRQYGCIVYENVYDNVDLELFFASGRVKYNFIVRPGGRVGDILMRYDGALDATVTKGGSLAVSTPIGGIEEAAPYTYAGDDDNEVESRFVRNGNTVSFEVAAYDRSQTLVIDPWATYYGGSGSDVGNGIVIDASGNIIISGRTESINLPVSNASQTTLAGGKDAFIAKFDANGVRLWATYFGGSGDENNVEIAVNTNGKLSITGHTASANLPVTQGAFQVAYAGNGDVFLAQFAADGTRLWATYYGGSKTENFPCVATDSNGDILFSGSTSSKNFPVSAGAFQTSPSSLFIVKMNENGTRNWATFFGAGHGYGICADGNNNVFVTGMAGTGFPVTTGAFQTVNAGGTDAFIAKFNGGGGRLWATYFGGSDNDWGQSIRADGYGDIVISGYTKSVNLPVSANAFQPQYAGGTMDGFVATFTAGGGREWATFIGGSVYDVIRDASYDANGNVLAVGYSTSPDFPTTAGVFQRVHAGGYDCVISQFTGSGARNWASYYGGTGDDLAAKIALDGNATSYFTGYTASANFPTLNPSQSASAGGADAFIVQLNSSGILPGHNFSPVAVATATPSIGTAPLNVTFNSSASYDPDGTITMYSWDFGDGGTSAAANPTHTYLNAGVYTALLTVVDDVNATATASIPVTVSAPGAFVYVSDQAVSRIQTGSNKWKGQDIVTVYNGMNQPVSGAIVTATYSGPNSGTVTGTTGSTGTVTLQTAQKTFPTGTWCFTVTNVQASAYTFNTSIGVLSACEATPKVWSDVPTNVEVQVFPNPFGEATSHGSTSTMITYTLPDDRTTMLQVFDIHGRCLTELVNEQKPAGTHTVRFDGIGLSRGVYYYRLVAKETIITGSITLLR